jgi:hypothetical protein
MSGKHTLIELRSAKSTCGLIADNPAICANDRLGPILLKNSVFIDDRQSAGHRRDSKN